MPDDKSAGAVAEPPTDEWVAIPHSYLNGDDNSQRATIHANAARGLLKIVSDGSCDADGSPRIGSIDPVHGQSTTSLGRTDGKYNGWKGDDGLEFVNSETIPYCVLPLNFKSVTGLTVKAGDIAQLNYNGRRVYAIFADEGPEKLIGEMSIKAVEALGGDPWDDAHKRIVSGIAFGVEYLIRLGSTNLNRCVNFNSIQAYGRELFGEATPYFSPQKVGDSGSQVEAIQRQINRVFTNIKLVDDGKFGPKTDESVHIFQTLVGLPANGIVDGATWDRLLSIPSESLAKPGVVVQPGDKKLTIPWATQAPPFRTSWTYDKGYPRGLVVHFTATGPLPEQEKGVEDYLRPRWSTFLLKRSGELLQTFPLNRGGNHCGTWHHNVCLGVEIVAAGRCTPVTLNAKKMYAPWYAYAKKPDGSTYLKYPQYCFPESEMRYVGPNKTKNTYPGWYQKYTKEQEDTLVKLCLFLKSQAPDYFDFDLVVGHDEACDAAGRPGEKNDPGAALSMDMPAFRELLKKKYV